MIVACQRRQARHAPWLLSHRACRTVITVFYLFFLERAKTVRPKAFALLISGSEGEQETTNVIRSHLEEHLLGALIRFIAWSSSHADDQELPTLS